MVNAVVDTNVIVVGVLTNDPYSASASVIDRHRNGEFLLFLSPPALLELQEVLAFPRLRAIHHLTDEEIRRFCRRLEVHHSRMFSGTIPVSPAITRDVTDTKWVALALEAQPDYLVTNDRRHLHRLRTVGRTQIVTPRAFIRELDRRA